MLYYKATAGCGVGMFVGVSARKCSVVWVWLFIHRSCGRVGVRCYSHWRETRASSPDRRSRSVTAHDGTDLPVPAAASVSLISECVQRLFTHVACMLISLILLHGD